MASSPIRNRTGLATHRPAGTQHRLSLGRTAVGDQHPRDPRRQGSGPGAGVRVARLPPVSRRELDRPDDAARVAEDRSLAAEWLDGDLESSRRSLRKYRFLGLFLVARECFELQPIQDSNVERSVALSHVQKWTLGRLGDLVKCVVADSGYRLHRHRPGLGLYGIERRCCRDRQDYSTMVDVVARDVGPRTNLLARLDKMCSSETLHLYCRAHVGLGE